jgi:hypothetical protein
MKEVSMWIASIMAWSAFTLASTSGQGSVTVSSEVYDEGTTVQLTANAAFGWHFDHWEGDLSGSTNPTSLVMDYNKSVMAVFVENEYTVYNPDHGTIVVTGSIATYAPQSGYTGLDSAYIGRENDILSLDLMVHPQIVNIMGQFSIEDPNTGELTPGIPDGLVMQFRGEYQGRPYNFDAVFENNEVVLIVPVEPTTAEEIQGYDPMLIQGHPDR